MDLYGNSYRRIDDGNAHGTQKQVEWMEKWASQLFFSWESLVVAVYLQNP